MYTFYTQSGNKHCWGKSEGGILKASVNGRFSVELIAFGIADINYESLKYGLTIGQVWDGVT